MLRPLMAEFSSVKVSLFHTPDLRGILKKIVPERFNETIGLTHIKIYLFDDSVIISGWVLLLKMCQNHIKILLIESCLYFKQCT